MTQESLCSNYLLSETSSEKPHVGPINQCHINQGAISQVMSSNQTSSTPLNYTSSNTLSENSPTNELNYLSDLKSKHPYKIIVGNLNINSIKNKFSQLQTLIQGKLDILVITETKIDNSFPESQFVMDGFEKPFRNDRNSKGGGVMVFVREDIPSTKLDIVNLANDIQLVIVEINLRKVKWLLIGCYNPHRKHSEYFLDQLSSILDKYKPHYDKFLITGDFNCEDSNDNFSDFLDAHEAQNFVKEPTCFKNKDNPSCIDLFVSNSPRCFQHTKTFWTGLSDWHKLVTTMFKSDFQRLPPKIVSYRDYKNFNTDNFKNDLRENLSSNRVYEYGVFEKIFLSVLDEHAPVKQKTIRANHAPYMTKTLRKAIMKRSELRTKYYKNPTDFNFQKFKKHKNFCSKLYKKERKKYYNNLDLKNIQDNRKFWETVKPFVSDKFSKSSKISLTHNGSVVSDDSKVANIFKDYFKDAVTSLNLKCDEAFISDTANLDDPVDIAIEKFKNHPSINLIRENIFHDQVFNFF